jgi:hypothetical protein
MALLKSDVGPEPQPTPLARVMREFDDLVRGFEHSLLRSLEHSAPHAPTASASASANTSTRQHADEIRREACRLAISDLSAKYTRKYIRRSLSAAESEGKRVEDRLHARSPSPTPAPAHDELGIHHGYFRLYSTELFDLLGQPTDLRFGTLRFHRHAPASPADSAPWVTVELALDSAFFVADSMETLPYHSFRLPTSPSLQNRGILSRKPEDHGRFPAFDSWLLFTFLGNGCIKLEVPIEMCADIYGGPLRGRENEEVLFWGCFIDDDDNNLDA